MSSLLNEGFDELWSMMGEFIQHAKVRICDFSSLAEVTACDFRRLESLQREEGFSRSHGCGATLSGS